MFESVINPILLPLLSLSPAMALMIISLVIAVFVTLIYKFTTNQELMKTLREDLKRFQSEMKQFRKEPQKMMSLQKQAMEKNMQYMMQSMKSTIFTMIPIIIVFGWLSAHLAYEPILPGQEFTTTLTFGKGATGNVSLEALPENQIEFLGEATQRIEDNKAAFTLKGPEGDYSLKYKFLDKEYSKDLMITNERNYAKPEEFFRDGNLKSIKIGNMPLIALNIFGCKIGWLGAYILFSIVFSMGFRKLLKLH